MVCRTLLAFEQKANVGGTGTVQQNISEVVIQIVEWCVDRDSVVFTHLPHLTSVPTSHHRGLERPNTTLLHGAHLVHHEMGGEGAMDTKAMT
jgi:hypothetical protein